MVSPEFTLPAGVHDREGLPADNIARPELMPGLGGLSDPDGEFPVLAADRSPDPESIAHVIVRLRKFSKK